MSDPPSPTIFFGGIFFEAGFAQLFNRVGWPKSFPISKNATRRPMKKAGVR